VWEWRVHSDDKKCNEIETFIVYEKRHNTISNVKNFYILQSAISWLKHADVLWKNFFLDI